MNNRTNKKSTGARTESRGRKEKEGVTSITITMRNEILEAVEDIRTDQEFAPDRSTVVNKLLESDPRVQEKIQARRLAA